MGILFNSLFPSKEQSTKEIVKQWILSIEKEHSISNEIVALNFGLFEPYGIELIGAKSYDAENADWACEEDFVPKYRFCPPLNISDTKKWDIVLKDMTTLLEELIQELPELQLWQVEHITIGFSDGDLIRIK
ncbi:hypothetical protein NXY11_01280 [Parabacteroides faecis]|uniref:hypothetical protein n=1 Tax=Parabacteroides faecis TaxID=1217282 RepID=UPI002164D844|nr:hypothetical protein [Parabacteroides faecis]MCS2894502.1 hypothetical protein [Parabacteroides faecis]UVQ46911.1 hypothetical protein NXY11_01280 [Parabacteroides faecis]